MEEKSFDGIGILRTIGKSLLVEMLISIVGLFVLALILSRTSVSDTIMGNAIIGISAFAIAFGGLLASRKLEMKGILCGALQGVLYMLLLYLISSIACGSFALKVEGIVMILVGIVCGGIGGIIGANLK
ncbi:MAG: TIGR04086 family membrane protein [Clostridia bacterium]|nr:TIGR04086 family membrane protein [Clostridia bacterium]